MADMSHHTKHNAHGFQPRTDAPQPPTSDARLLDLVLRREGQLNAAIKMPARRSESTNDEGIVPADRAPARTRQPKAPNTQLDALRKLSPANRNHVAASPFQKAGNSSQYLQIALLQSIDESLRRLRQLAEAGRQAPATFTPPET